MHLRTLPVSPSARRLVLFIALAAIALSARPAFAQDLPVQARVQRIADELKSRLGLEQTLVVTIVPQNALLFSVEPVENSQLQRFEMRVEDGFVEGLDDAELTAAVAHELGHMWIFTHHPYLQTEQLANDIAMRLVTRASLEHLYDKVWQRKGTVGDLAKLLGPQATAGLASSDRH